MKVFRVLALCWISLGGLPASGQNLQIMIPTNLGDPMDYYHVYAFAVAWSDAEEVAYVSSWENIGIGRRFTPDELDSMREGMARNWQDYLAGAGISPRGLNTEVIGWFEQDDRGSMREDKIAFLKNRLGYRVVLDVKASESFRLKVFPFATLPKSGVQTHTHAFQIEQDGLEMRGTVDFNAQMLFFGYPYLKASYTALTIEAISYADDDGGLETYFDEDSNKRTEEFITFPYVVSSGGYHLEADFDVRLPSAFDRGDVTLMDLSRNIFMFEVKDLTPVADTYADEEVDAYFREYQHEQLHDSQIWEAARLDDHNIDPVRLRGISPSIVREIRQRIDEYRRQLE